MKYREDLAFIDGIANLSVMMTVACVIDSDLSTGRRRRRDLLLQPVGPELLGSPSTNSSAHRPGPKARSTAGQG
jgi:hypothetical protein